MYRRLYRRGSKDNTLTVGRPDGSPSVVVTETFVRGRVDSGPSGSPVTGS